MFFTHIFATGKAKKQKQMKNKDTFRFKIVEETTGFLSDDLKTVKKNSTYYLYMKVSWFLGGWLKIMPKCDYCESFASIEGAKNRAHEYVENILTFTKNAEMGIGVITKNVFRGWGVN